MVIEILTKWLLIKKSYIAVYAVDTITAQKLVENFFMKLYQK